MRFTKIAGIFVTAFMAVQSVLCTNVNAVSAESTDMRDITSMELVRDMGIGINLGNTMESCGDWIARYGDGTVSSYETAWGSPVITEQMIQGYANEGFGVLRVPVAWSNMMGSDYTINEAYTARVKEIVDWALKADLYCIINIHYDNGWVNNFYKDKDECMKRYIRMWTQICDNFKDYGDHLIFESQNEELGWGELWDRWAGTNGKAESYALVNEINQKFVDTVRASGGNNPKRHLLISGYNTDIELTCDSMFQMPNDPENRCAVSIHYYTPAGFAILEEDASWAKCRSTWGTQEDRQELARNLDMMRSTFIDKGIPVIMGEYGCPKKNKEEASVREFLSSVCREAYDRQICPIMWDVTGFQYDRENCRMYDTELKSLLNNICDSSQKTPDTVKYDVDANGVFDINDVIALKDWLIAKPDAKLYDWEAADINKDGVLNVFDLCLMKREFLKK